MEIIENFKKVMFENFANFNGRAGRGEYWWFVAACIIISVVVSLITTPISQNVSFIASLIVSLIFLIPSLAVSARRLHDINKSGWWILIALIPIIGTIWFLILTIKEGDKTENKFGSPVA